jgi:hypothetical protein
MDKDDSPDVIVPGEIKEKTSFSDKIQHLRKKFSTR